MATFNPTNHQKRTHAAYRRVVVKAGTNVLTGKRGNLNHEAMISLASQIAGVRQSSVDVILVTSGAIAAGREIFKNPLDEKSVGVSQMLAAIGQSRLMHAYQDLFATHGMIVAQALLTHQDVEDRRGYLNVRNTFAALLANGIVPIINENDVVNTEEISRSRFGDNDTLSALVANIVDADLLLILSDVAGLYSSDPNRDASARLIERIESVDESILALAEEHRSSTTRGGMQSKLLAARRATAVGVNVVIASGNEANVVTRVVQGEAIGTFFPATSSQVESRKRWLLSGTADTNGVIEIDDGAMEAIRTQEKSLLPAGIQHVRGKFHRGDVVSVAVVGGEKIAVGITNYDAADLLSIKGAKSTDISNLLGHSYGEEAIHRNNMVVL